MLKHLPMSRSLRMRVRSKGARVKYNFGKSKTNHFKAASKAQRRAHRVR